MSLYEKSLVGRDEQQEESGWTAYLQDFSENNMMGSSSYSNNQEDYGCSIVSSPSLVSDAATYGARRKKKSCSDHRRVRNNTECSSLGGSQVLRRLNLKNPKTSDKYYDPDLEDTASSPVNSPKDRTFRQQVEINLEEVKGKETGFEGFQEMVMGAEEERSSINFDGKLVFGVHRLEEKRAMFNAFVPVSKAADDVNITLPAAISSKKLGFPAILSPVGSEYGVFRLENGEEQRDKNDDKNYDDKQKRTTTDL
nr:uncharacterized protein LOC109187580 [Ipomoea batatas]